MQRAIDEEDSEYRHDGVVTKWTPFNMLAVMFGFVGGFMVFIAAFKLIDGEESRNWGMGIVAIAGAVERKNATVSGRFYLKDKSSLAHCLFCTYGTHRLRIEVSHA